MIAYSPDAELARAYLLRAYNDIDIFVEDSACQNMYVRLFGRMLDGKAKVSHVFPLRGRNNVITQCLADQAKRVRRRLYIIDGDHDLLTGRRRPPLRHMYRLGAYCAENLLLSERAAIFVAMEGQTSVGWQEAEALLNFHTLIDESVKLLIPLFVVYAIVNKLDLPIESTKYSVIRLLDDPNNASSLSKELINKRITNMAKEIIRYVPTAAYSAARKNLTGRLAKTRRDPSIYISGKAYLLPLLQLHLRRVAQVRDGLDNLKVRLAQHAELSIDPGLKRALLKEIKGIREITREE